jgi:hypothetical protein
MRPAGRTKKKKAESSQTLPFCIIGPRMKPETLSDDYGPCYLMVSDRDDVVAVPFHGFGIARDIEVCGSWDAHDVCGAAVSVQPSFMRNPLLLKSRTIVPDRHELAARLSCNIDIACAVQGDGSGVVGMGSVIIPRGMLRVAGCTIIF